MIKGRLGGLLQIPTGHSGELATFFPELEGRAKAGWASSLLSCVLEAPSAQPVWSTPNV